MERAVGDALDVAASRDFYIFTSYLWSNHLDSQRVTHYGNHYYLPYHRDRLVSAAQALGWANVVSFLRGDTGLDRLSSVVEEHLNNVCDAKLTNVKRKIKVCIYRDTRFHVESTTIAPTDAMNIFPLPVDLNQAIPFACRCVVRLDVEPTPTSLFTAHKTSERGPYDRARSTADIVHQPPTNAEILLFNFQNQIMECSLSTPYFRRNGRWVTPPLSSGGHAGVTRRLSLERVFCEEQVVLVESLRHEEAIWISNAVRGFLPATLLLRSSI